MKTLNKFGMAMLAMLALAGCGSNKQATSNQNPENTPFGTFYDLPCVDASLDDDEYFKGLGVGTHVNLQSALLRQWMRPKVCCKNALAVSSKALRPIIVARLQVRLPPTKFNA